MVSFCFVVRIPPVGVYPDRGRGESGLTFVGRKGEGWLSFVPIGTTDNKGNNDPGQGCSVFRSEGTTDSRPRQD